MIDKPPVGQRFSHVYIQRGEPTQDSPRMRRRLAALFFTFDDHLGDCSYFLRQELGIDVVTGQTGIIWGRLFDQCELRDLLDTITLAYRHAVRGRRMSPLDQQRFRQEVDRIFKEENVHYRVDERGGVHFRYDAEFEHNRAATIAALQGSRYRAALASYEGAMAALAKVPPDGKTAIRDTFGAAETLFKLTFPNSPRLTADETEKLQPLVQRVHAADKVATRAATMLLRAFKDWIDAAQNYRHEAGQEEPVPPPLSLTVQMVSLGASFIRWLVELDAITH
jgi:hypothetical protein